jgi:hypothetical protein
MSGMSHPATGPTHDPICSARTLGNDEVAELIALAVLRSDRVLMVASGPKRWLREMGCTLVPLELPGGAMTRPVSLEPAAQELGALWLGTPLRVRSSRWVYGPSQHHALDRRAPLAEEAPAPLVHLSRLALDVADEADGADAVSDGASDASGVTAGTGLRSVAVRIYWASCDGQPVPGPECGGLLELPFAALRSVVRGMPLAEVVSAAGVHYLPAPDTSLPDDALLYLPSEYGERYLLRVVAKYGVEAIVQGEEPGAGHEEGQGEDIDEPGF